jgi:hypothetical protein
MKLNGGPSGLPFLFVLNIRFWPIPDGRWWNNPVSGK